MNASLSRSFIRAAILGSLALTSAARATITLYTDQALFDTASRQFSGFTEKFANISEGENLLLTFSGGTPQTDYTIISSGKLWRNTKTTEYGSWLSTEDPNQPITIGFTAGNTAVMSGNFFLTDEVENPMVGTVDIIVHGVTPDGDEDRRTITLTSNAGGAQPFFGVIATDGDIIGGMTILASTPGGGQEYPTFTNFQVAAAVPEAAVTLLSAAGIAAGLLRRRRAN